MVRVVLMDQVSAKRTIKYLAVCKNPETFRQVVRAAPDRVIKSICNAALNAIAGDVVLTEAQRKELSKFRNSIIHLASRSGSLKAKRALLLSKDPKEGGFYFLPDLLTTVLSSLRSPFLAS